MVRRRKPGRRPTPGPKRNERIPVLVTPELKGKIVAEAKRNGETTSEWMQGAAEMRLAKVDPAQGREGRQVTGRESVTTVSGEHDE